MEKLKQKPKGKVALYVVLLVLVVAAMALLRKCRSGMSGDAELAGGDTLKVAMQYAPGSFYVDNDTLAGRDYEALASLGLPYKIYPITDPAEGLDGLRAGRYDLVVADMPQTADSTGEFIYTSPVYLDHQALVQRVDSAGAVPPITSPLQLVGKTVVVAQGSPMVARLQNLEREIGGKINLVERDATSERLLIELALGADSVPLVVANSTLAAEIAADYPQLDLSVPVSLTQFQPWILRSDDKALRDRLNSLLNR